MTERPPLNLKKSALYGALTGVLVCIPILLFISWQTGKWSPWLSGFAFMECLRFAFLFALVFLLVASLFNKLTGRKSKLTHL